MDRWDVIKWSATLITFLGTALTTSLDAPIRMYAFSVLLISNTLWIIWSWRVSDHPILVTYVGNFIVNSFGVWNNMRF
jgi:hypothetical protein